MLNISAEFNTAQKTVDLAPRTCLDERFIRRNTQVIRHETAQLFSGSTTTKTLKKIYCKSLGSPGDADGGDDIHAKLEISSSKLNNHVKSEWCFVIEERLFHFPAAYDIGVFSEDFLHQARTLFESVDTFRFRPMLYTFFRQFGTHIFTRLSFGSYLGVDFETISNKDEVRLETALNAAQAGVELEGELDVSLRKLLRRVKFDVRGGNAALFAQDTTDAEAILQRLQEWMETHSIRDTKYIPSLLCSNLMTMVDVVSMCLMKMMPGQEDSIARFGVMATELLDVLLGLEEDRGANQVMDGCLPLCQFILVGFDPPLVKVHEAHTLENLKSISQKMKLACISHVIARRSMITGQYQIISGKGELFRDAHRMAKVFFMGQWHFGTNVIQLLQKLTSQLHSVPAPPTVEIWRFHKMTTIPGVVDDSKPIEPDDTK